MSTIRIVGEAMVWTGKVLQTDIATVVADYAKELLKKQAEETTRSWIERLVRSKEASGARQIGREFAAVYQRQNFNAVMAFQVQQFDKNVLVPLVEWIEEYKAISDDRFYALPKFIVRDQFESILRKTLRSAEGLPQVFDDVFGREQEEPEKHQTEELRTEKISKFIEFASDEAATAAIKEFDRICEPSKRFMRPLKIKSVRGDVFFWGQNPSMEWKEGKVRGHYYFDKRREFPAGSSLADVKNLQVKLEASLFQAGTLGLASELENAIGSAQIPSSVRNHLSVKI
ncbi:hypothetical protein [uncultured Bradyrhizobium sp.]|uniref:hypothetical protein n=1 Tax=uncultured Bradyrhizobium sp. TaxID=199684 RepID=UPI00263779BA|nr:hypothetical protein [uncultured Bradyrhizobium sp.]